jgi:hypothetical protein
MKFSKLVKKSYKLLEQGPPPEDAAMPPQDAQAGAAPAAGGPTPEQKQAGDDIEKAGEKMSNQVETAMDEMVSLLGKIVDFLRNEQRMGQAKYPPKIANLLNTIKKASLSQTSAQGLGEIEDAVQEVDEFYNKKSEEPVQEGYFYKKYIKKGK